MALNWKPTLRKSALLAGALVLQRVLGSGRRAELMPPRRAEIRRILVVELWNIGDVILTMPFLAQLRAIFPDANVTFLGAPHAEPLLRGTGLADEFIETDLGFPSDETRRAAALHRLRELRAVTAELRRRKFDLAFQSRLHVREHLLLGRSGAKRTVGYALGRGKSLLTDPIPVSDPDRQKVDDWMELLEPFGGTRKVPTPHLAVSAVEVAWADRFLEDQGMPRGASPVGIHPGASKAEKRWPLERFERVAAELAARGLPLLAFADQAGYGSSLGRIKGVARAQGNLRQMIALIARCRLLVCNDSGPMHIAGALGVPTVAMFGSSVSRWYAPLGAGHKLLTGEARRAGNPAQAGFGVETIAIVDVLHAVERTLKST